MNRPRRPRSTTALGVTEVRRGKVRGGRSLTVSDLKPLKLSEKAFQEQIVGLLSMRGFYVWETYKFARGGAKMTAGIPDLKILWPGGKGVPPFGTWWELKIPGGKVSTHQLARHAELRAAGEGIEVVWTWEQAVELLASYGLPVIGVSD